MQALQGVWQRERSEPGVGLVLPRVPPHLPTTATTDQSGATVRQPQAVGMPGPGAGSAGQLHTQPAYRQDSSHTELTAGHHQQTEAQETVY